MRPKTASAAALVVVGLAFAVSAPAMADGMKEKSATRAHAHHAHKYKAHYAHFYKVDPYA